MRQVTGSNPTTTNKKVSIQLQLGGHSFSCDALPTEVDAETVIEVELLTPNSILVPAECFEPHLAYKLLEMSGVVLSAEEIPVWSNLQSSIVAVMALPKIVAATLNERYGNRLQYTSPLLFHPAGKGEYLYIYSVDTFCYVKLFEGEKLLFGATLPTASDDELLCCVERLVGEFGIKHLQIGVAGANIEKRIKLLKQYHKVEKCE